MNLETFERLQMSFAELLRATFASTWFWESHPCTDKAVLRERRRLQRAARANAGNPLLFFNSLQPEGFTALDIRCPERAAVALCSMCDQTSELLRNGSGQFPVNDSILLPREIIAFFQALAARPGRRRLQVKLPNGATMAKYDEAAALRLNRENLHRICMKLEPAYSAASIAEKKTMRNRMRSGINRVLLRTKLLP